MRSLAVLSLLGLVSVFLGCMPSSPPGRQGPTQPETQPFKTTKSIPPKGISDWKKDLQSPDPGHRLVAARQLGGTGAETEAVLLVLTELLQEKEVGIRESAAQMLVNMGLKARGVIPALTDALADKEPSVRGWAARALGRMGAEARKASPRLKALLQDKASFGIWVRGDLLDLIHVSYRNVRSEAAEALGRIGPEAEAAIPALQELLKDDEAEVRGTAAGALGRLGAKAAIPRLTELLDDKAHYFKGESFLDTEPLELGGRPYESVTRIRVRAIAAEALGRIGPEAKGAVPALTKLLDDKVKEVRLASASALGNMGPAALPATTALKKIAEEIDEDQEVRQAATDALQKLEKARSSKTTNPRTPPS
jgi:HEAT repeat protein